MLYNTDNTYQLARTTSKTLHMIRFISGRFYVSQMLQFIYRSYKSSSNSHKMFKEIFVFLNEARVQLTSLIDNF